MGLSGKLRIVSVVILSVGFLLGFYMGDVFSISKIYTEASFEVIREEEWSCNFLFCIHVPNQVSTSYNIKKVPNTTAMLITWGIAGTFAAATFYSAKYIENK